MRRKSGDAKQRSLVTRPHRFTRQAAAFLATVTVLSVLTGCVPPERKQTVVETPKIIWRDGAPDAELDSNVWVKALRDYNTARVLSENLHDFSITQLTDTVIPSEIGTGYTNQLTDVQRSGGTLKYLTAYPGPIPFIPLSVTEAPDGASAEIVVCVVSDGWVVTRTSKKHPTLDLSEARQAGYRMVRGSDDKIRYKVGWGSTKECDATNMKFGYFTPSPTIPESITAKDIIPPIRNKKPNHN